MRKIIFFGIGLVLIITVVWGILKITKSHQNVSGETAEARITSATLYSEFFKNEDQANKKWVGRVIEVSGIITSISESGNYIAVNLRGTSEGGVNCSILKKDMGQSEKINMGDSITIKGKCTGFLMDVNMVDCIIEK
jgi:hypothetical protein